MTEKKIESGGIISRPAPGYFVDKNTPNRDVKIIKEEEPSILEIFKMKAEGKSYSVITEEIHKAGFRNKKGNKVARSVIEVIYKEVSGKIKTTEEKKIKTSAKISKLEIELVSLRTMRRKGEISSEDFIVDKNQLTIDIEDLHNRLIKFTREISAKLDDIEKMCELLVFLSDSWLKADYDKKVSLISEVPPLKCSGNKREMLVI